LFLLTRRWCYVAPVTGIDACFAHYPPNLCLNTNTAYPVKLSINVGVVPISHKEPPETVTTYEEMIISLSKLHCISSDQSYSGNAS